ncbi:MAG: hypothetical protein ACPG8W_20840 [Candidatus Promineifilaceae bacterium]
MIPQKIQLKLFLTKNSRVDLHSIIPVFHRWIQTNAVDGLLIDVANYAHVPTGPGVMLVGHEVDYAIDLSDGRVGLLHTRKPSRTAGVQTFSEQLQTAIAALLKASEALTNEPTLNLKFAPDEIELRIIDRLVAPNSASAFDTLRPAFADAFAKTVGNVTIKRVINDNRRPLTAKVTLPRQAVSFLPETLTF